MRVCVCKEERTQTPAHCRLFAFGMLLRPQLSARCGGSCCRPVHKHDMSTEVQGHDGDRKATRGAAFFCRGLRHRFVFRSAPVAGVRARHTLINPTAMPFFNCMLAPHLCIGEKFAEKRRITLQCEKNKKSATIKTSRGEKKGDGVAALLRRRKLA